MTGMPLAEQLAPLKNKLSNVPDGLPKPSQPVRSQTEEILEVVRAMPGLSALQISELVPHIKFTTIGGLLSQQEAKGIIRSEKVANPRKRPVGNARGWFAEVKAYWPVEGTPRPTPVPFKAPRASKAQPTDNALRLQLGELKQQVIELKAWKADAIARYPDLAVEPIVIEARQIVAETTTDTEVREAVLAGERDTTLVVRATVEALRRARS